MDIKIEMNSYKAMGMWTLMYDLLYTKAGIIHTWPSYSILVASSLAATASFLLFQFSTKDGHGRVDVAIILHMHTLLSWDLLLETASLLGVLGCQKWWIKYHYSGTGEFLDDLKHLLFEYTKCLTRRQSMNIQGVIRKSLGRHAFELEQEMRLYNF